MADEDNRISVPTGFGNLAREGADAVEASIPAGPVAGATPRQVPMQVYIPEDLIIQYADSVVIQLADEELVLSFLQFQHPIALTKQDLDNIEAVEILCLARIALSPARAKGLLDGLQYNLNEHKKKYSQQPAAGQEKGKE